WHIGDAQRMAPVSEKQTHWNCLIIWIKASFRPEEDQTTFHFELHK
ncbi:MAG: hypothetical protein ACI83B_003269, partial [Sediminicola sp.]